MPTNIVYVSIMSTTVLGVPDIVQSITERTSPWGRLAGDVKEQEVTAVPPEQARNTGEIASPKVDNNDGFSIIL